MILIVRLNGTVVLAVAVLLSFVVGDEVLLGASPFAHINSIDSLRHPKRISRFRELEGKGLRCIAEDSSGNIWCGIRDGVARYDGFRWIYQGRRQGLPESPVHWLASRASGSLVAATDCGLFELRGESWVQTFPRQADICMEFSFVTESDDGTIWACCPWGLIRLDESSSQLFTGAPYVAVAEQTGWFDQVQAWPDRSVPVSRHDNGIDVRLFGDLVASVGPSGPAEQAGLRVGDRILSVNGDHQAIGSQLDQPPGAPVRLKIRRGQDDDPISQRIYTGESRDISKDPSCSSVLIDSQNQIWVAFDRGRLLMSSDSGQSWTPAKQEEQTLLLGIRPHLFEAQDGTIWCVSVGRRGTVARFDGRDWHTEDLKTLGGVSSRGMGLEAPDGRIWVGGLESIAILSDRGWRTTDARRVQIPSLGHRMIASSDGAVWIGGYNQALVRVALDESEFTSLKRRLLHLLSEKSGATWYWDSTEHQVVRRQGNETKAFSIDDGVLSQPSALCKTPRGLVLIGGHQGVAATSTFDGERWTRVTFPEISASFSLKSFSVTKDGQVWIASRGPRTEDQVGGLICGFGDQWTHHAPPQAPVNAPFVIELLDGRMWFGGKAGVISFDGNQWSKVNAPLLADTSVTSAAIDSKGVVWLATRTRGVLRYRDGRFKSFTVADGLPTNGVTKVYVGEDDQLLVGTMDGPYRFDGGRFFRFNVGQKDILYPIRSDGAGGVWINGRVRIGRDTNAPVGEFVTRHAKIKAGGEAFLSWRGVDKWNRTPQDRLHWSWRVDGGPWSPYTRRSDIVIRGLAPGEHRVQLRCRDGDFNVTTVRGLASVEVLPPYWQTARFLVPTSLAGCLLMFLAVRLFRRGVALRIANRELAEARSLLADQYAEKTAQFKAICDCSPVGIFVTDAKWDVTYVNPRFTQVAGRTESNLIGQEWLNCVHSDDRYRIASLWQHGVVGAVPARRSGRFIHPDGTERHFELVVDRIERDGKVLGYVGALEDVTVQVDTQNQIEDVNQQLRMTLDQLRATQEQVIKQERLTALGQMAAGVAHDMNNSLTPLLTYAQLLEDQPGLSEDGKAWARLVRLGVSDTAETVRRLDHFYRDKKNVVALKCVDLAHLVKEAVELTRPKWSDEARLEGRSIKLTTNFQSTPFVMGDPSQLRAALTNLIFNSIDAISDHGSITILVDRTGDCALVEVSDSGCGMSEEALKRCTDPFFTSKERGSGLGLSECFGIARQHGGELVVESSKGFGTLVRMEIPLSQTPLSALSASSKVALEEETRDEEGSSNDKIQVLCIDDDETVRASTTALLQSRGIRVQSAVDGPSGIAMLEKEPFDLVVCDHGLPGMDGLTVMKQIKSRWPKMPVAMVSGWSLPEFDGEFQPDAVLQKPFATSDFDDLLVRYAK